MELLLRNSSAGFISRPLGTIPILFARQASSTSRWKKRQEGDTYAQKAKVQGFRSRAAFKLLEMDAKHRIFKKGQIVVDLGYAPGSWTQVAIERTKPKGRVIGIDLIPAQPPKGADTFQGNFLSPGVQKIVKDFIIESHQRRTPSPAPDNESNTMATEEPNADVEDQPSYIEIERHASQASKVDGQAHETDDPTNHLVDVVLSDMLEPLPQISGFSSNTLSNPYHRLMNTSGIASKDHSNSMELCNAALTFATETLKQGGHFICKFYQGSQDKELESRMKTLFSKVYREKPDSSRKESREAYLIGLRRRKATTTCGSPE